MTADELVVALEALAASIERQRDHLRQLWISVMIVDEGVEEEDLEPLVRLQRREIVETAAMLDHAEASRRSQLDRARFDAALRAALIDLVAPKLH